MNRLITQRGPRKPAVILTVFAALTLLSFSGVRADAAISKKSMRLASNIHLKSANSQEFVAPDKFIAARAQKVLSDLKSRPLRPAGIPTEVTEVEATAAKGSWLSALYRQNMVEASWATQMLSDKRIFAEVLKREMGRRALVYYPKTIGLREFLYKRNLVDRSGRFTSTSNLGDRIEAALHDEFPSGFFVRPAVGVAPKETGRGLFQDSDQFIVELLKPENRLYSPEHMRQPIESHILGTVASGEALVLQENIVGSADALKPLSSRFFHEVRVHTYEGRVVEDSIPKRWVQKNALSSEQEERAAAFTADFLRSLPLKLMTRQAWGVDVAVMDNGELRVIDVVTNRGKRTQWSSYLEQPQIIGAYTRHFETYYRLRFSGLSGTLIRNNFANYFSYWEKRIEKAKPGLSKVMAFFPPIP